MRYRWSNITPRLLASTLPRSSGALGATAAQRCCVGGRLFPVLDSSPSQSNRFHLGFSVTRTPAQKARLHCQNIPGTVAIGAKRLRSRHDDREHWRSRRGDREPTVGDTGNDFDTRRTNYSLCNRALGAILRSALVIARGDIRCVE